MTDLSLETTDALALFWEAVEDTQPALARELKEISIVNETKLSDLGIASIAMYEIAGYIEDKLDISLPEDKLSSVRTVGDVAALICSASE